MTLVYRSPKLQTPPPPQYPGPGQYSFSSSAKQNKPDPSFISSVSRSQIAVASTLVGPGDYSPIVSQMQMKITTPCRSVFKSNVKRFSEIDQLAKREDEEKDQFVKELNGLMQKQKENLKVNTGKIITMKERKMIKEATDRQHLPSIPSWQQSFGYKYDSSCKKLVSNENPKVLLSHPSPASPNSSTYFFSRLNNSNLNANHSPSSPPWKRLSPPRSPVSLLHQLSYPTATHYKKQEIGSIGWKCKGRIGGPVMKETSICDSQTIRQSMKSQVLKKKYGKYFKGDNDINLNKSQQKESNRDKSQSQDGKQQKTLHFLSKQVRFKKDVPSLIPFHIQPQKILQQPSIQPYSIGSARFPESSLSEIGPGYYNQSIAFSGSKGRSIHLTQPRFKQQGLTTGIPGPGTYSIEVSDASKTMVKMIPETKKEANSKKIEEKQTCVEFLYQKYGKKMNTFCKTENVNQHSKSDQFQAKNRNKKDRPLAKTPLTQAKQNLSSILQSQRSQPSSHLAHPISPSLSHLHPKYHHLYNYSPPNPQPLPLGPGQFELRKTLQKKTFNVTYD